MVVIHFAGDFRSDLLDDIFLKQSHKIGGLFMVYEYNDYAKGMSFLSNEIYRQSIPLELAKSVPVFASYTLKRILKKIKHFQCHF